MYVLIQSNIYKNPDYDLIYAVLDELAIPYEKITLTSDVTELKTIEERNDIFIYGSVKLAILAKKILTGIQDHFMVAIIFLRLTLHIIAIIYLITKPKLLNLAMT